MFERLVVTLTAVGAVGGATVWAQQGRTDGRKAPQVQKPAQTPGTVGVKLDRVPVKPSDPVATVNNEVITRQQLADECVARKGEEILETLVVRKLIEQETRALKLEVTAQEVDAEIDKVALTMGNTDRENWLRILHKDRGISPVQYARDIIYPELALRKLARKYVQVTPEDIKNAYESQFGEKIRCRIIMTGRLDHAKQVWDELKKNPGAFEKVAMNDPRSIDQMTKPAGGLMADLVPRHAEPRSVSDAMFEQLVDLPANVNPKGPEAAKYRPKDGDITGPIQVSPSSWAIFRRETLVPAQEYDKNNKDLEKQMVEAVTQAQTRQKMKEVLEDLMRKATIDNKLTGQTNTVAKGEEPEPGTRIDPNVKLMSDPNSALPKRDDKVNPEAAARPKAGPPPGVSKDDLKKIEAIKK